MFFMSTCNLANNMFDPRHFVPKSVRAFSIILLLDMLEVT